MKKIRSNIISRWSAQLLLAAIVLTLFFGQGVHLHFSFHDLFDHHDSPVVLHSHTSSGDETGSDSNDEDSHDHAVAIIQFNGNISSSVQYASSETLSGQTGAVVEDITNSKNSSTEQLAIPPPLRVASLLIFHSLSIRAPPEA